MADAPDSRTVPETRTTSVVPPSIQALLASPSHGDNGPTDVPIHALHRGPSGFIPFARKVGGVAWEELGGLSVGQPMLPELERVLLRDAYFGVNTSFRAWAPRVLNTKTRTRTTWQPIAGEAAGAEAQVTVTETRETREATHPESGLPYMRHASNTLRWLNACYVDIDCYNVGRAPGAVIGELLRMQDDGELPMATQFVRSGRGVWVLWFLRDELNPTDGEAWVHKQRHTPWTPQRATRFALLRYATLQGELCRRLAHLGADVGAVDGPRYMPVPGTRKTKGSAWVRYLTQHEHGAVPLYTQAELAAALGVELESPDSRIVTEAFGDDSAPSEANRAKGIKGYRARYRYLLRDVEALYALRRGYGAHVSRHDAARLHAHALHKCGFSRHEVLARVSVYWEPARYTKPGDVPGPNELDSVVKAACRYTGNRTTQTVRSLLRVTPAEATHLDAVSGRRQPETVAASPAKRQRDARRAAIEALILEHGTVPTTRAMAALLAERGVPGNWTTVRLDYQALGLAVAAPGRPPAPAKLWPDG